MTGYDQWKQETPPEPFDNKCGFCGEPCDKKYCDNACKKADIDENCRD